MRSDAFCISTARSWGDCSTRPSRFVSIAWNVAPGSVKEKSFDEMRPTCAREIAEAPAVVVVVEPVVEPVVVNSLLDKVGKDFDRDESAKSLITETRLSAAFSKGLARLRRGEAVAIVRAASQGRLARPAHRATTPGRPRANDVYHPGRGCDSSLDP